MAITQDFRIVLSYEKHSNGRYYVHSQDIPGFRLVGPDLDALQRDLDSVVIDLFRENLDIEIESLKWVPSLEDVKRHLERPEPEGTFTYIARMKAA